MNVFEIATSRIISVMELGVIPWTKPWMSVDAAPYNIISKKKYSLINSMLLGKSGAWGTYKQWSDIGCKVRKGERSSVVFFWKMCVSEAETKDSDASKDEDENIRFGKKGIYSKDDIDSYKRYKPCLRYYNVFHQSQTDCDGGISDNGIGNTASGNGTGNNISENGIAPFKCADNVFKNYIHRENISFEEIASNSAWYSPSDDKIHVPSIKQYTKESVAMYHQVCFHEAAHSTGSASRLDRQGIKDPHFGSEKYAKEELIAELASYYLLNTLGIDTEKSIRQNAGYLQSWIKALKGDSKLIVFAAPAAEKAARFILGESRLNG